MPSALPSHAQKPSLRKSSDRSGRKITTLSFQQIDRTKRGIFTEDISAASRRPRPAYVVRENDVIGANMPDTIRLSKHRSKIYVGLSDASSTSGHSSHRVQRAVSRERASATSISKASIIDWTDTRSEASTHDFSGEFSASLPPVAGAKNSLGHPPPGLDTAEIFSFRSVVHKKRGDARSPRPSLSRGSVNHVGVPRPPHNTPFPALLTRPDEFAATFRKRVIPRKIPLDNCNVVLIGGSIAPLDSSREGRGGRGFTHREQSFSGQRKDKRGSHPNAGGGGGGGGGMMTTASTSGYMGFPRFDLPMIDLKCVESPIANLGDLEEKGIRLVKLRSVKKKKTTKETSVPNTARSDPAREEESSGARENAVTPSLEETPGNNHVTLEEGTGINSFTEADTSPPFVAVDKQHDYRHKTDDVTKESPDMQLALSDEREPEYNTHHRKSSITTPSTGSDTRRREAHTGDEDAGMMLTNREAHTGDEDAGMMLTNREPYSTPLLPDVNTSSRAENPPNVNTSSSRAENPPNVNTTSSGVENPSESRPDNLGNRHKDTPLPQSHPSRPTHSLGSSTMNATHSDEKPNTYRPTHGVHTFKVNANIPDETGDSKNNQEEEKETEKAASDIEFHIERMDNTPTPIRHVPVQIAEAETEFENEGKQYKRFEKRSSSLLTVPDSLSLSEVRPPSPTHEEDLCVTFDFTAQVKEMDASREGGDDVIGEDEAAEMGQLSDRRKSVTVATQTLGIPTDEG